MRCLFGLMLQVAGGVSSPALSRCAFQVRPDMRQSEAAEQKQDEQQQGEQQAGAGHGSLVWLRSARGAHGTDLSGIDEIHLELAATFEGKRNPICCTK